MHICPKFNCTIFLPEKLTPPIVLLLECMGVEAWQQMEFHDWNLVNY